MGISESKNNSQSVGNFKTFTLLWLDAAVNETKENVNVQNALRGFIHKLHAVDNIQSFEEHLKYKNDDDGIVLIVSGSLGRQVVPKIHSIKQVVAIYVYCYNADDNEKWSNIYSKVRAVVTNPNDLICQIKIDYEYRQQNQIYEPLAISVFDPTITHEKLTRNLLGHLTQSQLLINTLLQQMPPKENDMTELLALCRTAYHDCPKELDLIEKLMRGYRPQNALEFYTKNPFFSSLLNKALRTGNMETLHCFHFFLHDIETVLAVQQCQQPIRAFRSELMPQNELDFLRKSVGQFISINSFLLADSNVTCTLDCLKPTDQFQLVLFVIDGDPNMKGSKSFAKIPSTSVQNKDEILFMVGSICQIIQVDQRNEKITQVRLRLCADDDQQLENMNNHRDMFTFGHVLVTVGKLEEAERYFHRFLGWFQSNDFDRARCHYELALVLEKEKKFEESIEQLSKTLDLYLKKDKREPFDIAAVCQGRGDIYRQKQDYKTALEDYNFALNLLSQNFSAEGLNKIAIIHNNIGSTYFEQQNYKEALKSYKTAREIREKSPQPDHTSLGMIYNNLGNTYCSVKNYDEALKYYECAMEQYRFVLPAQHPKIASLSNNVAAVYEQTDQRDKALEYYRTALKIFLYLYPPTDPKVITVQSNIKRLSPRG